MNLQHRWKASHSCCNPEQPNRYSAQSTVVSWLVHLPESKPRRSFRSLDGMNSGCQTPWSFESSQTLAPGPLQERSREGPSQAQTPQKPCAASNMWSKSCSYRKVVRWACKKPVKAVSLRSLMLPNVNAFCECHSVPSYLCHNL